MTGTSAFAPTRDGRRLHHVTTGGTGPLVVFESGMGASRSSWGAVVPVVAERARCVTYDRAGLGRSPHDSAPRHLGRLVDDLEDLLEHLGGEPVVLVAHSWGGPVVRLLTARRPELVAGLVLVDQTDERCDLYFTAAGMRQQVLLAKLLPLLARIRLTRLQVGAVTRRLPPQARADLLAEDTTVPAARAFQAELAAIDGDLRGLLADPPDLGQRPVTWISGTKASRVGASIRRGLVAAHRESAAAHPGGRHVEAPASGHLVMFSEPQLVADEVLRLVDHLPSA